MSMTLLPRFVAFVALTASALLTGGCIVHDDDDHLPPPSQPSDAFYTTIDADQGVSNDSGPGYGVGVFVEYGLGGVWTVDTYCDTALTDLVCAYEINVFSRAPILDPREANLELDDSLYLYDDYTLSFSAYTDFDSDGFDFITESPGALVEIELILDGYIEPQHFRWFGNGRVHDDAPLDVPSVVFQPDQP